MKCMCVSTRLYLFGIVFLLLNLVAASTMADEKRLKPFVLAQIQASGSLSALTDKISKQLAQAGFDVVGQYSPYKDTSILIISNEQMRRQATKSAFGAYGAIQRVTISKTGAGLQVAYTNPTYMAHAYRMKTDYADVSSKLAKVLGHEKEYGSEEGLTKEELRDYQYKWLMPYFSDRNELVDYGKQEKALARIEKVLASNKAGVSKVYRVDLPGKDESVIGVSLKGPESNECSGDQYIMSRIDFKKLKSAGHLPYEFVVSNGKAYALYAEFRIAINFPDLSMMGSNSFASIMCAPTAIKTALTKGVGGKEEEF